MEDQNQDLKQFASCLGKIIKDPSLLTDTPFKVLLQALISDGTLNRSESRDAAKLFVVFIKKTKRDLRAKRLALSEERRKKNRGGKNKGGKNTTTKSLSA